MITHPKYRVRDWLVLAILVLLVVLLLSSSSGGTGAVAPDRSSFPVPAQTEELVFYPAAVLVGEYCKAKRWD